MHELSLTTSIVETVTETLAAYPGARVKEVRLRVGALASVIPESLEFCWGIVCEGPPLEGSRLAVSVLPVVVHCALCGQDAELEGVQSFRCPRCGELCGEIRQGRELEIDSIEIDEATSEIKETA
ncbi:MAG: hydrogenase maturation nickel metallochaperone HypA [Terracidiphilus sp.]|jgi:hydrogenase nickel incorporation protein HypA/HybF